MKEISEILSNEPKQLDPMILEDPGKGERIQVEIRSDSKTAVDWIKGKARVRREGSDWEYPVHIERTVEQ